MTMGGSSRASCGIAAHGGTHLYDARCFVAQNAREKAFGVLAGQGVEVGVAQSCEGRVGYSSVPIIDSVVTPINVQNAI